MFTQDRDLKFNPSLKKILSNHMSRYSLVRATAKRARQIIAGEEPLVPANGKKPLSIAVEELYESKVGKYKTNMIWINLKTDDKDIQSKISEDILNFDGVASVSVMSTFVKAISDMLNTMNYVVVVLIVTSAMLDFVVLYNLANINIGERQREIATLKVLGFYDKEVDNYINKENVIFTIIGIALGLVFGTFLTSAIISSIEIDRLRFTRNILTSSYIWSAIITASFSFIVNKIIHFILKKIDMIESLKSVE